MLHNSRRAKANLIASLCLLIFAQPGASDDWTAEFVFPATTGYVMHNMDVMEVSYKSNYPNASLWCFCYNGKEDPANLVISTCRHSPNQTRPVANHFALHHQQWACTKTQSPSTDTRTFNSTQISHPTFAGTTCATWIMRKRD